MIQRLAAEQRDWRLLYAVRSRARAAYLDILLQRYPDRLSLHVDEEAGGVADLAGFLRTAPADAQLYCCGPTPMLDAFESATADRQPSQVHLERFKGSGDVAAGGFTVIAAASGGSHFVAEEAPSWTRCWTPDWIFRTPAPMASAAPARPASSKASRTIATPCSAPQSARRTRKC